MKTGSQYLWCGNDASQTVKPTKIVLEHHWKPEEWLDDDIDALTIKIIWGNYHWSTRKLMTWSSPRRPLFLHAVSFEWTTKF